MDRVHLAYAIAALCAALLLLHLASLRLRRWAGTRQIRRRARRAARGEIEAEELLRALGYEVLERQARTTWVVEVGGEETPVELRADLIVERHGRVLVAEVKTGDIAPLVTHAPTRRQLLEYLVAFAADGILLVEPEAGEVEEVRFPGHEKGPPGGAGGPVTNDGFRRRA